MQVQVHAETPIRPAVPTETVSGLQNHTRGETRASAPTRPVAVPRGGRRRVLVVEDEQDIADLIRHTLERGGDIEVEQATSGDAALKACPSNPPTWCCST
jgi:PleD family two-component response regulator